MNTFLHFDPPSEALQLKTASIFCELAKGGFYLYCLFLSFQYMAFSSLTLFMSFAGP